MFLANNIFPYIFGILARLNGDIFSGLFGTLFSINMIFLEVTFLFLLQIFLIVSKDSQFVGLFYITDNTIFCFHVKCRPTYHSQHCSSTNSMKFVHNDQKSLKFLVVNSIRRISPHQ